MGCWGAGVLGSYKPLLHASWGHFQAIPLVPQWAAFAAPAQPTFEHLWSDSAELPFNFLPCFQPCNLSGSWGRSAENIHKLNPPCTVTGPIYETKPHECVLLSTDLCLCDLYFLFPLIRLLRLKTTSSVMQGALMAELVLMMCIYSTLMFIRDKRN